MYSPAHASKLLAALSTDPPPTNAIAAVPALSHVAQTLQIAGMASEEPVPVQEVQLAAIDVLDGFPADHQCKEERAVSDAVASALLGVPEADILIDTLAEHSTENVFYSYELGRSRGFSTFAIATDPFQCGLLYNFSRKKFETEFYFLPIIYDSIRPIYHLNPDVDMTSAYIDHFVPLGERESYGQRIKASRGKKIQFKEE